MKPGMDYFHENAHYNSSGKWGITQNGQYKVINEKEYNVKHLFFSSVHNIWGTYTWWPIFNYCYFSGWYSDGP